MLDYHTFHVQKDFPRNRRLTIELDMSNRFFKCAGIFKMCTLNVEYITCSLCYRIDLFVDLQRLYVLEPQEKR